MFTGPIEDRLLIRERYGTYSDSAFQQDVDAWLANWSENGVWHVLGEQHRGKAMLRKQWELLWGGLNSMAFFAEIGAIAVSGNTAAARAYCREIVVLKTGQIIKAVGFYDDELVKDNNTWLFTKRTYSVLLHESN